MSKVLIFTGEGKGKTTASIGVAARALGKRKKVAIVQFFKHDSWFDKGEVKLLADNFKNVSIFQFGKKGWVNPEKPSEEDKFIANQALAKCKQIIKKDKPFLLIADEILLGILFKIFKVSDIEKLINLTKEKDVHLILTGRGATKELINKADLVTEMQNVKHYYDSGISAIEGIDF